MARFTIDDLERDKSRPEPFQLALDDDTIVTFPDPKSLHFTKLLELTTSSPAEQVRIIVGDDFEVLAADPRADGYFFEALMQKYIAHYGGIPDPGEAAASSRSSNGTGKRSRRT
jgi:hypothetical protein